MPSAVVSSKHSISIIILTIITILHHHPHRRPQQQHPPCIVFVALKSIVPRIKEPSTSMSGHDENTWCRRSCNGSGPCPTGVRPIIMTRYCARCRNGPRNHTICIRVLPEVQMIRTQPSPCTRNNTNDSRRRRRSYHPPQQQHHHTRVHHPPQHNSIATKRSPGNTNRCYHRS